MIPRETRFNAYELTESELVAAQTFSELNLAYLKTLRADEAEKKVNLKFDTTNPLLFAQQEAESSGIIGILDQLIDGHNEVVEANRKLVIQTQDSNTQE